MLVAIGVVVVAAIAVYGVFGANVWRWGCPSQEELERPRAPTEVVDAFAERGLSLERIGWPAELRRARAYEGAAVYRYEAPGTTLTVVVCVARCELSRFQLRPGKPRERHRFGFSTVNIAGWIAGEGRAAAARLRQALGPPLDELDASVDPDSRCYVE